MNVDVSLSLLWALSYPFIVNFVIDFVVDFDSVIVVSFVEINDGSDTVDDLVAIKQLLAWVQVTHLQAEQVLFGDHRRNLAATKVVHGKRFDVALGIPSPEDDNEAAYSHFIDRSRKCFVCDVCVLLVVSILDESPEGFETRRV